MAEATVLVLVGEGGRALHLLGETGAAGEEWEWAAEDGRGRLLRLVRTSESHCCLKDSSSGFRPWDDAMMGWS